MKQGNVSHENEEPGKRNKPRKMYLWITAILLFCVLIGIAILYLTRIPGGEEQQVLQSQEEDAETGSIVEADNKAAPIPAPTAAPVETSQIDKNKEPEASVSNLPTDEPEPVPTETAVQDNIYISNLPVIYIDTANAQAVTSKVNYIDATARIYGAKDLGGASLYEGSLRIRGRGNSTWMAPKKPYKIKLEKKADLFHMGEHKDWILLANYYDQSLMRNMLAFGMADKMGFPASDYVSVDLVMNGTYAGNYLLCRPVEITKDLIEIQDWEKTAEQLAELLVASDQSLAPKKKELEEALSTDLSWITDKTFRFQEVTYLVSDYIDLPDITGGYLLELDDTYDEVSKFKTASGQPIMFKSPEYAATNKEMLTYVQEYIQAFEDAVRSEDFSAEYKGARIRYSELADMETLVDFWILTEVFGNLDSMFKSTYMYKDIDGKLKFGPIWDFDLCAGGSMVIEFKDYAETWQTLYRRLSPAQGEQWYRYLLGDTEFRKLVYNRYHSIRATLIEDIIRTEGVIDQLEAELSESGQANLEVWPTNSFWNRSTQVPKYEDKVEEVRDWMKRHIAWLDLQFETYEAFCSSLGFPAE